MIFLKSAIGVRRPAFVHTRRSMAGSLTVALLASAMGCSRGASDGAEATSRDAGADTALKASDTASAKPMAGMTMPAAKDDPVPPGAQVTLTAAQIRHGGVAWQPATMGTASATVSVPGQLVPDEDRTARLGAPAAGRVIAVPVRPGDRVARGQLLVTLQSPEAAIAQSDLAKARAELASRQAEAAYAKSARDRAERLLALKAIPRQDYERATTDDELARSAVAHAEAELTRARTSADQLGAAVSATGEIALRAPLAGVVLARTAVPGTVIDAGAPLAVVTDPTRLWLTVNAPEALAGALRAGTMLRFSVPAYSGETFAARVDAVGAGLDPGTRTLSVRATVDNRSGRLKPEMIATVSADGGQRISAVLVPDGAVQTLRGKPVVFLARPQPNGTVQFVSREVDVGSRDGGRAAVTRGLVSGDIVVTSGAFAVKAQFEKSTAPKMEM